MSTFDIKLIAIALMVVDHIGAYLLPEYFALRVIGRLSFPLFAWLIANGAYHTQNPVTYLVRLSLFAIISQLPFVLVNNLTETPWSTLNIFFTLSLGLGAILLLRQLISWRWKLVAVLSVMIVAQLMTVEYGAAGVLSILAFYWTYQRNWKTILTAQLTIFMLFFTLPTIYALSVDGHVAFYSIGVWEPVAALSSLIVAYYTGEKGRSLKYLFYLFYPVHLLIFYFLR